MSQGTKDRLTNLRAAPRCGARNRRGSPCQCPAISQHSVAMARLVAISLLPQVAGVVFMFAIALLSGALQAILARLAAPPTSPHREVYMKDFRIESAYGLPSAGRAQR